MKTSILAGCLAGAIAVPVYAQKGTLQFPKSPNTNPPPPKVYVVEPPPPPLSTWKESEEQQKTAYVYDQKPMSGRPDLVSPEQAQTIISRFKDAYPKMGSPRFLIYVNRELVDEKSGMKLIHRTEAIQGSRTGTNDGASISSVQTNEYRADGKPEATLADKQTVRDVERLFGRPLRDGGAALADQKVAAQLIADRPLDDFIGSTDTPESRKDREALGKIADAVIEVLISSKNVTVPTISGSDTVAVPDIQATAIRLSDSRILAQASSSDVTSRVPPASLGNYDVREITEATALALMEDMTPNQP